MAGMHDIDDYPQARTIPGLALARVKQDLLVRLKSFGLAEAIGPGLLFPTLPSAVDAYRRWVAAHPSPASCPEDDRP